MAYPNVPNVPGVPPLPRNPLAAASSLALLVADTFGFFISSGAPQWGIFQDSVAVVAADSVVSFDFKQDWSIADYPVEQGAFETYDKVETPFGVRIRFATGGSDDRRQAFLDSIAAIAGDFELYDVVTPEVVYTSVNISHYDYHRRANQGNGLITVDVWLTEIRETAVTAFSNTKRPSGAEGQNGGTVQTAPPTTNQQNFAPFVE